MAFQKIECERPDAEIFPVARVLLRRYEARLSGLVFHGIIDTVTLHPSGYIWISDMDRGIGFGLTRDKDWWGIQDGRVMIHIMRIGTLTVFNV